MQEIPIYEVWLESWTMQDLAVFGSLAAAAFVILTAWARRRARPTDPEGGLDLGQRH